MKKIIDGVICDTENAKFITGHIVPGECWELYQTQTGEYFRYIEKENIPDEIIIPYKPSNQYNKLIKLAEENNRELKKNHP